jgi:hypothetical protein
VLIVGRHFVNSANRFYRSNCAWDYACFCVGYVLQLLWKKIVRNKRQTRSVCMSLAEPLTKGVKGCVYDTYLDMSKQAFGHVYVLGQPPAIIPLQKHPAHVPATASSQRNLHCPLS